MTSMPVLSEVLHRIGLAEYLQPLVANGFHDWETVLDITEEDLANLDFKLGHRRNLQREIATFRGLPSSETLEIAKTTPEPSPLSLSGLDPFTVQTSLPAPKEKRRYRRHPRPDANAPKKPKTAYVNFADELRTNPEVSSLSFVDIAKEVGRRWQVLPAEKKRVWESHAARAMQEYETQLDEYKKTDSWHKHQAYLKEFKEHQTPDTKKPKRPTTNRIDSFIGVEFPRGSPASSDSPSFPPPPTSGTEPELCHNALTHASSELVSLRGEILVQGIPPYDGRNLPLEEPTRRAMHAFVRGTASLLYTWTYAQVDEILDRIYRPKTVVDAMTLAECFTIAAAGSHYEQCLADPIRKMLFASATLHFHERTVRMDYLRSMRLLLCMSLYALAENHMSARYLVAAGLQVARWTTPPPQPFEPEKGPGQWRKVVRSLIVVDCWLSSTLGYTPEFRAGDQSIASTAVPNHTATIDETIQTQALRVGLLAAETAQTMQSPHLATGENMAFFTLQLDAWLKQVPPHLKLSTLTSTPQALSGLSPCQWQSMLVVHITYFGALIQLYRQLMILDTAPSQSALKYGRSADADKRYKETCGIAAQTIARVLRIISSETTPIKPNWLLVYWAYISATILLLTTTRTLLTGLPDGAESLLSNSKSCIDFLDSHAKTQAQARRFSDKVFPLYDHLRDIHHRMVGRAKTSIFMLVQQSDPNLMSPPIPVSGEEIGPIEEKLGRFLGDDFGSQEGGWWA